MDALSFLILLLIGGGTVAFIVWSRKREKIKTSPEPMPVIPVPPPKPEPVVSKAVLKLPSSHRQFQFTCHLTVLRQPLEGGPTTDDPQRAAEWAMYAYAKDISSMFALTEHSQLQLRLDHELPVPRKASSIGLAAWAHCDKVEVEKDELELVRKLNLSRFEWLLEQENFELLDRRVERLGRVMADPRTATLWWFAQNQDKLDELPRKAEVIYNLDQLINPQNHAVSSSSLLGEFGYVPADRFAGEDGRDLEDFIGQTDVSGKAAVGLVLSGVYRSHGRQDLAERASRLTQPAEPEPDGEPESEAGEASPDPGRK